jgi:hypothetical protein
LLTMEGAAEALGAMVLATPHSNVRSCK